VLRRWWAVLCLCECGSPSSAIACDGLSEVVVSIVFIVIRSFAGYDGRKDGAFPHILELIELFRTVSIALHEQVSKQEIRVEYHHGTQYDPEEELPKGLVDDFTEFPH
jgi:hypothetical protein